MRFSFIFLYFFVAINGFSQIDPHGKQAEDQLFPISLTSIKVDGEIGRRIDVTIENNLLKLNIDKDFLFSFQKKNDAGYIGVGKLIDGTVKMASYTGNEKVITLKNHLIGSLIEWQEPDGYIGNMSPANRMVMLWDIHEMGYIINGLVTDFKLFGDKKSLEAAKNAADYILKKWYLIPPDWGNTTGVALRIAITGLHRTMLSLYCVTNDHRYLDFCLNQLDLKNLDPDIVIGRRKLIEGHIYGYMAGCLAQLEMYRISPDEKLLVAVRKAIDFITNKNGMSITGGAGQDEIWTADQDGGGELGETCATAYQLRIYDNLLRLKGDSRYGDIMERTIYNALFGAQSPEGRQIRYYTPLEGDRHYHNGDTYCCPCNYRRVISELPSMVYYGTSNGLAINLYSTSSALISIAKNRKIAVSQETDYPNTGRVIIHIDPSGQSTFELKLRIPSWCRKSTIMVNGRPSGVIGKPGTFAVINRNWNPGDQVTLDMPMDWRLVRGRERQAGRAAVMRGPLLFSLSPDQNMSLTQKSAADLGRIVIDLTSIQAEPIKNNVVRPGGIACRIKADDKSFSVGNAGGLELTLTEFPDPDGKCTYFKVPDLSETVPDELTDLWK